MPEGHSILPKVTLDSRLDLTMAELVRREVALKQLLKIGSMQDAIIAALSNWFGPSMADPMFTALFDALNTTVTDTMKVRTLFYVSYSSTLCTRILSKLSS